MDEGEYYYQDMKELSDHAASIIRNQKIQIDEMQKTIAALVASCKTIRVHETTLYDIDKVTVVTSYDPARRVYIYEVEE